MALQEFRTKINELERYGSSAEAVSPFADSYYLSMRYNPDEDSHLLRITPKSLDFYQGSIGIVTLIQCDPEENFGGLIRQDQNTGNRFKSILRIWVTTSERSQVMVDYDVDSTDPSIAQIVNVYELIGLSHYRGGYQPHQKEWDGLIRQAKLPQTIDISASIHRLITGDGLTDQTFEAQPLVPR